MNPLGEEGSLATTEEAVKFCLVEVRAFALLNCRLCEDEACFSNLRFFPNEADPFAEGGPVRELI